MKDFQIPLKMHQFNMQDAHLFNWMKMFLQLLTEENQALEGNLRLECNHSSVFFSETLSHRIRILPYFRTKNSIDSTMLTNFPSLNTSDINNIWFSVSNFIFGSWQIESPIMNDSKPYSFLKFTSRKKK